MSQWKDTHLWFFAASQGGQHPQLEPDVSTRKIMLNDKFLLSDIFQFLNRGFLTRLLQVVSKVLKLAEFSKVAELLVAVSKNTKKI